MPEWVRLSEGLYGELPPWRTTGGFASSAQPAGGQQGEPPVPAKHARKPRRKSVSAGRELTLTMPTEEGEFAATSAKSGGLRPISRDV